ncbi:MAG: DUF3644 domain-containing protein [Chloroflexota bacterium]|nr:DUF3644 domain-containing protein [Chloroflexota bacterium]
MHLARLYLLHAELLRDRVDFRYWDNSHKRLVRVDGEPKTWELARCARHRWPADSEPVLLNLNFFIGLRNRIEHRFQEGIALSVAGHSQALLLNYESELVHQFGSSEGLADRLRFPVFLSSLTDEGIAALKKVRSSIPARASRFMDEFHASLDDETAADSRFEFRMYLVPQVGPKTEADMAITFVQARDLSNEQRDVLTELGRTGVVATRTKHVPVQNAGRFRPSDVVARIKQDVPEFTMGDHTWMWHHFTARPQAGSSNPAETDARYCVYDEPVKTHLYTEAWVRKVLREAKRRYESTP